MDAPEINVSGPNGETVFFVNVWDVDRVYGGPEEGGWWYDAGECIKTVVCLTREQADEIHAELSERFPRTGKRSSVLYGEDYDVTIDDEQGTFFPENRPHYE